MVALSIVGDSRVNVLQEKLAEGIHLRWGFERDLGFPWHGFYLYRRVHQPGNIACFGNIIQKLALTGPSGKQVRTPYGTISSDRNITLTDEFPSPGISELDLENRNHLRFTFPADLPVRKVEAKIGFRGGQASPQPERVCPSFRAYGLSIGHNPRFEQGIKFEVKDGNGNPVEVTKVLTWETDPDLVRPDLIALRFEKELEISLTDAASSVELRIMHVNSPPVIRAFNDDGTSTGWVGMRNPLFEPETVTLTGNAINRIVITAPREDTYLLDICCQPVSGSRIEIPLTLLSGEARVARATATGRPGQITSTVLEFDLITAVEIGAGPAVLVDLCFVPVSQGVTNGWERLSDFPYPMSLPVGHTNYPASLGIELTIDEAKERASQRVKYGQPGLWPGKEFTEIHQTCFDLVKDGPVGVAMADRSEPVPGIPDLPDPNEEAPKMPEQHPLDLLLLAALHPPIAQMIGLYWVDQTAEKGVDYDYLIVADYSGVGRTDSDVVLSIISSGDFTQLKSYIVFDQHLSASPPLAAPENHRVYALPGLTFPNRKGDVRDGTNNAGLRWDIHLNELGELDPFQPIMYNVWRANLGNEVTPQPPGSYNLITREPTGPVLEVDPDLFPGGPRDLPTDQPPATAPVVVVESELDPGEEPRRFPDWPPFPLHFIDRGLADGWYSYQVSGVDIFGRHSPNGSSAVWYQWAQAPDPPWYYIGPSADQIVHASAVRLLDKTPPPPPTAVEAYALDPADPTVVQDAAYRAWRASLNAADKDQIGLRVKWLWTKEHIQQAPDVREFRIYYHPGQMNTVAGSTTQVSNAGLHSFVSTNIANAHPLNAYAGTWLRIGADSFKVVGSDPGSPLKLHVKNIGPAKDIAPRTDALCLITVPQFYSDGKIEVIKDSNAAVGINTQWNATMTGSRLRLDGELTEYTIAAVSSPTSLLLDRAYDGTLNTKPLHTFFPPSSVKTGYVIRHPLFVDFSKPANWRHRYHVVGFDDPHIALSDGALLYEVFLPAPDTNVGQPFAPTLADPVIFANIGVSAADDKVHTPDDPLRASEPFGGRFGNEGKVGAPVGIFRVRRGRLDPPATVAGDSDKVFATRADYSGHSFYTYRWQPSANLKTHIFRAMDDAVFNVDWAERPLRANPTLDASQKQFFPDEALEHLWDATKRQVIADELNVLNDFSRDAAGKTQAMDYYRGLSNDALRVLAGLAGNERAFTQITILPLDPQEPDPNDPTSLKWGNRRTPSDPDSFILGAPGNPLASTSLRIYIDTLDGRATNRYFYRCAYTDGAHNPGALSLSSLPVYLPNLVPPRAPVFTRVIGGDRRITLHWSITPELDLIRCLVFRTEDEDATRDIRLLGNPVAQLPATTLIVNGGQVDLREGTDLALIERVYKADELGPQEDPFTGGTATQLLAAPSVPIGTTISGLNAADGTRVVVIYRDSKNVLQRTPIQSHPDEWTDADVSSNTTYYVLVTLKQVTVSNQALQIPSRPSKVAAGQAFDVSPPDPAQWVSATRVKVDASGNEHPFDDPISPFTVAIKLNWSGVGAAEQSLVQKKLEGSLIWESISAWMSNTLELRDNDIETTLRYQYRIKTRKSNGQTNASPIIVVEGD